MNPIVYVVQNTMRADSQTGELVPKFDLSPARRHGELRYLLSPSAGPWTPEAVLPELARKLDGYRPEDFLLLVGSPILIGWAVALAAQASGGVVQCLQWSGSSQGYRAVRADLDIDNYPIAQAISR